MSSKKPFEHIEEKIKQAAENSLPAFDEKAWQAMEAKLDKEQKRRRPLIWWILLPLVLAGGWGVYMYDLKKDSKKATSTVNTLRNNSSGDIAATDTKVVSTTSGADKASPATIEIRTDANKKDNVDGTAPATFKNSYTQPLVSRQGSQKIRSNRNGYRRKGFLKTTVESPFPEDIAGKSGALPGDEETSDLNGEMPSKKNETVQTAENTVASPQPTPLGSKEEPVMKVDKVEPKRDDIKEQSKKEQKPSEKKKKNTRYSNGLYLMAMAGADVGNTKPFSYTNSSVTARYGLGVGYRFNNRLSVQTGFYATNKKYVATTDEYKVKPGSPMSQYNIEKIKAANLVYEIPLSIRFDIVQKPSIILYGIAGASTYIMQKEKYDCSYWYYNNLYEREWKFTGNRHFFSTAVFSFGIEKPLSNKFSLLAEPSFSLPLSGVGDGSMKIYSTALLLGIKYQPFKK